MFKITRQNDRIEIEMSGKLDTQNMIIALDELVSLSENIENGTMLFNVIDYHLPSLGAIKEEFSQLPSMLDFMKKFRRAALLTDKMWLKMIAELEGALYPGLEIKAFRRNQRSEAEEWLSEVIEEQ
jgi:hypothetical protein